MTIASADPSDIDPGPAFLSVRTIASSLDVHELTVYAWARAGRIPVVRFPNRRIAMPIDEWRRWTAELAKLRDIGPDRSDPNIN